MRPNLSTEDFQKIDAKHHYHPFTAQSELNETGVRVITKANGVHIWDSEGNRILDGMAGLWCLQVGHGNRKIIDAVYAQMQELTYYNTFFKTSHIPAIELSEKIADLTPKGFNRTFFTGSGSESNDTVFRMVRTYWDLMEKPQKKIILGRKNGYHGSTVAGASLGGMKPMHEQGDLPIGGIYHINQPYWFDEGSDLTPEQFGKLRAQELEHAINLFGEEHIAAFIAEPIQGAGGVIIPPQTYWPEIKKIIDKYEILLIADEVICGFGRTGNWFGSQTFGIEPDLMSVAKGLSSGYLPIGGVILKDKIADVLSDGGEFVHGFTYSGHPAACAAAIANLDFLIDENIIPYVQNQIGPYLQKKWLDLVSHPLVGEARMKGLIGALEIVPSKPSRERFDRDHDVGGICRDISFENGLIMRATKDTLLISPPLVIQEKEADELIDKAIKTLDDSHKELKKRNLI